MGTNFVDDNEEEKGIIPRAIQNIFDEVQEKGKKANFSIKASFIEVFNLVIIIMFEVLSPLTTINYNFL